MRSKGSYSTSGREKEGKDGVGIIFQYKISPIPLPLLARVSRQKLMMKMIMKWSWGLCTDLLAFALQLRGTPENVN